MTTATEHLAKAAQIGLARLRHGSYEVLSYAIAVLDGAWSPTRIKNAAEDQLVRHLRSVSK